MANARTGWSRLAPSTRARYERSGIGRTQWEQGADLREARGHRPPVPADAAPAAPTERYVHGEGTEADYAELAAWRRTEAPGWLPSPAWIADDTAAALSQLRDGPHAWSHVEFTPSTGEVWQMRVDYRRGYSEQIDIPSGSASEVLTMMSAAGQGADELEDLGVEDIDEWEDWIEDDYDFDVGESM